MYSLPLWLAWAAAIPFGPPPVHRYGDPLPPGAVARLGFVRTGSNNPLNTADGGTLAAFSPDGKSFASVCYNRIYVWDVKTGRVRRRFQPGDGLVGRLAFTADGKSLVVPSQRLYTWDLDTGREVRRNYEGMILWGQTALSPGGRWLIDGQNGVWDLPAGKKVVGRRPLPVNRQRIGTAFTTDERWLFLATARWEGRKADYFLEQWDIAAGQLERSIDEYRGGAIACSPDGRTVAATLRIDDPKVINKWTYTIVLYDTATGRERLRLPEGPDYFEPPVFSPDGKRFAAVTRRETLRVWDAATGKEVSSWTYKRDHLGWLAFSPDGKTIGICGTSGTAVLWDVGTGKPRFLNDELAYRATDLLFSPDSKALVAGYTDGSVRQWDLRTQQIGHTSRYGEPPAHSGITDLGWVGTSGTLAFRTYVKPEGEFRLLNWKTGRDEVLSLGEGVSVRTVSAAARTLVVGSTPAGLKHFQWQPLSPQKLEAARQKAQARPELKNFRVIAPAPTGEVARGDLALGTFMAGNFPGPSHVEAVSPDGGTVVEHVTTLTGGAFTGAGPHLTAKGLRLVDADTGRVVREFPRPNHAVAFTPDGRALVLWKAADRGPDLELVEARTGSPRWKTNLGKRVGRVVVSPCGRWLAVSEYEGDSLHFVDATTGKVMATHRPGRLHYGMDPLAFSPDGRLLARSEGDGTILVWRVPAVPTRMIAEPTAGELAEAWRDLSSADAALAFRALLRLTDSPAIGLPRLRRELLREDDRERIERLVGGLNAAAFSDRERATRELGELGAVARPYLARALRAKPSLEARTRIEKLLAAQPDPFATPAGLRQLRAVEALERIGSADGRRELERLADGNPDDDPLAREAQRALERLKR